MTLDRRPLHHPSMPATATLRLYGRRIMLRPLVAPDFAAWSEIRRRNNDWLTRWEPRRLRGAPDPAFDKEAFGARCSQRDRERQFGQSYSFGVFVDQAVVGEVNINNVMRGAMQSCTVGYWIDEAKAGRGYTPEAVALILRFAFDELSLHRVEVNIVPRNISSRRVAEKLELREEGTSERFVEIAGVWEDHVRYAITAEEWQARKSDLITAWL
jgi:[ribosomal protein S5]-alanine N-acetyltransferase